MKIRSRERADFFMTQKVSLVFLLRALYLRYFMIGFIYKKKGSKEDEKNRKEKFVFKRCIYFRICYMDNYD
jgi:hypothetical protein